MEATPIQNVMSRLSGVIWGDAKTGKTTWAMSLPGKKLLVNFDPDGYYSVAHRTDFDLLDLSHFPPQEAMRQADKVGEYILKHKDEYQSVIVDSLTTLVEIALHDAVLSGVGKGRDFVPTIDAPGLAAYGGRNNRVNSVLSRILRATSQATLNCFFIAHQDDPEFEKDGKTIVQHTMMLSAKIRNIQTLKMSEIYHIALASGDRRVVYTAPFGVKKPMGSRIFDTRVVKKFDLVYDIDKSDEEQAHALSTIIKRWTDGGRVKLTSV